MPTPPPSLRSVGDFIRAQRELMSLSMRQLAEMAQVSNPYLSQIERGVYKPSAQVLKGIADALDLSAETIYREVGLLDDSVERPMVSVEDAIRVDTRLTQEGKQALIQVYQGLVAARPAPERSAGESVPVRAAPVRRAARKAAAATTSPETKAPIRASRAPAAKTAQRAAAAATARTTPSAKSAMAAKSARKPVAKSTSRTAATRKAKRPAR